MLLWLAYVVYVGNADLIKFLLILMMIMLLLLMTIKMMLMFFVDQRDRVRPEDPQQEGEQRAGECMFVWMCVSVCVFVIIVSV